MPILRTIRLCAGLVPAAILLAVAIGLFAAAHWADSHLVPWDVTGTQATSNGRVEVPWPDSLAGAGVAVGGVILLGVMFWRRRRLAIAALVSAVLLEVVAFTWFRSYYGDERIGFCRTVDPGAYVYTDRHWFMWYRGRIEYRASFGRYAGRAATAELMGPPRRLIWSRQALSQLLREVPGSDPPTPSPTPMWLRALGFVLWAAPPDNPPYYRHLGWSMVVPHAAPAIVLGVLPALWLARFARRSRSARRHRAGACVHCGYDLRASSGRCPECGAPAPVHDVSGPAPQGILAAADREPGAARRAAAAQRP